MEAAAKPFPIELTTPPVTKMNLVCRAFIRLGLLEHCVLHATSLTVKARSDGVNATLDRGCG